jgi:hypothetical protein
MFVARYTRRKVKTKSLTRLDGVRHIRTMSAATSKTMLAICRTLINFSLLLAITAGQKQSDGGCQFGLALLSRNLHICRVELSAAVGLAEMGKRKEPPKKLLLFVDVISYPLSAVLPQ